MSTYTSPTVSRDTTYLTPPEVAEMLGVAVQTLSMWRSTGRYDLPYVRCGGRVRYIESDVLAWLDRRRGTSTAAIAAGVM